MKKKNEIRGTRDILGLIWGERDISTREKGKRLGNDGIY